MFLGLYFAEDYLQDMLTATYFGEKADVFLCTQEGNVIASSDGGNYRGNLLASLTEANVIDAETAQTAQTVFTEGGRASLLCGKGCKTDNLCVMGLSGYDYVLVQAFPKNVTQSMVSRAALASPQSPTGIFPNHFNNLFRIAFRNFSEKCQRLFQILIDHSIPNIRTVDFIRTLF